MDLECRKITRPSRRRSRLDQFDFDVLAQLLNRIPGLQKPPQASSGRIEVKVVDGLLQARAAQDLLGHALQTILKIYGDVGRHKRFGVLLLFDDDGCLRLVRRRQEPAHTPYS
jgi:hypothetical protein